MNKRKDRKDCIAIKGKENYEFDLDIELNKYKYLCGEKLSKKQWKALKNEDRYETYDDWKKHIEQRYANYPVCMLNELYRYIIHRKRRLNSFFNFMNPYIGAIYSVTFAFVSSLLMEISKIEVISDNIVFRMILAILIYFGICYLIIYVCTEGLHLSSEHSIKEGFLTDYLEIIEEIIKKRDRDQLNKQTRLILIGSPGSGKSYLARSLSEKLNIPVYHMDNLYWRPDKTHVTRAELVSDIADIMQQDEWIIDGNYISTMEQRIQGADVIIYLDFSTEQCIEGILSRVGKKRDDIPWIKESLDKEFLEFVQNFKEETKPQIEELLKKYQDKHVIRLTSKEEKERFKSITNYDELLTWKLN